MPMTHEGTQVSNRRITHNEGSGAALNSGQDKWPLRIRWERRRRRRRRQFPMKTIGVGHAPAGFDDGRAAWYRNSQLMDVPR